jgi:hypothetical protein
MGPTAFKAALVRIALAECEALAGIDGRDDPRLLSRIRRYYDDLDKPMLGRPADIHYSAIFISWCMRQAGASEAEFPTEFAHWEYASRAVASGAGDPFVARALDQYAVTPGDLVHFNRKEGRVSLQGYEARYYPSDSGIVTAVKGNTTTMVVANDPEEQHTVLTQQLDLTADGTVVQRAVYPFICIIEVAK